MSDPGDNAAIRDYLEQHAPLLYLRLDAQGAVTHANRFAQQRLGDTWQQQSIHTLSLFSSQVSDLTSLRKDPHQVHLIHLPTNAGLPETFRVQFLSVGADTLVFGSLDADETMQLRKELLHLNNQLNALTRELQKKNHELAQLNQLKNQFLAMAAHDVRKPLSSIMSYTEFLMDEVKAVLSAEHFGFLGTIHASAELMRRVIDDFLDIAMIESGRFDILRTPTDMAAVIEASLALNRLIAQKRGVTLCVERHGEIGSIAMDGAKIEQVLNNLIANAIEHTAEDSKVDIRLSAEANQVTVAVEDNGPGIPPQERATLFQPFARGQAFKHRGAKSTGLGLAISKKIVEAHGGKIWIEGNPGQGVVFVFSLPIRPEEKGAKQ